MDTPISAHLGSAAAAIFSSPTLHRLAESEICLRLLRNLIWLRVTMCERCNNSVGLTGRRVWFGANTARPFDLQAPPPPPSEQQERGEQIWPQIFRRLVVEQQVGSLVAALT